MRIRHPCLFASMLLAGALPALAAAARPVTWEPEWNLRLRHESVSDDGFARNADATTLRLRAGLRGEFGDGFSALVEGEGVAAAGGYNSGANGKLQYPAATDPRGGELNQAWLGWADAEMEVRAGRQRVLLGNQRWVGNSGWRQNEQTFDAVSVAAGSPAGFSAQYVWIDRVHRVGGDDALDPLARERRLNSHSLELGWKGGIQILGAFVLLHEDRDVQAASTATVGLRALSDTVRDGHGWSLALEWAQQRDHAGNPLSFAHRYWRIEPAITHGGITWRAGVEHLGGDGRHALQTPLASLHPFNGWADRFGTIPASGLQDRHLGAGGRWGEGGATWALAWHDYRADASGGRLGSEWNASLAFPLGRSAKGLLKLADYRADGFSRDTRKAWLQLEWAN